ncbi:MAG: HEAT repeat domain-containing protein [Clostridia bacterium]|nr:HEAT repeat domain-containing protein [Clostridia bacterium]
MFFFGKDIYAKIESWKEKGLLGKLLKEAETNGDEAVRIAAWKAIGSLHAKEAVDSLLAVFRTDETEDVKLAAADALSRVATKAEFDSMIYAAEHEESEKVAEMLKSAAIEAKERQMY